MVDYMEDKIIRVFGARNYIEESEYKYDLK